MASWEYLMLHGKTSPFLILFPYSRLARGGVGGGAVAGSEGGGRWNLGTQNRGSPWPPLRGAQRQLERQAKGFPCENQFQI